MKAIAKLKANGPCEGLKSHSAKASGYEIIGKTTDGEYVRARETNSSSHMIYQPVYAEMISTGEDCITCVGWWTPEVILPLTKRDIKFLDRAYKVDTVSCEICGMEHDSDASYDIPFTARESAIYCMECVPDDLRLKEVTEPHDLFQAYRIEGTPKGFTEVETLFCDSSGLGGPGERALTQRQAEAAMQELLDKHGAPLYAGLTGVGQFQVYVTIYRKVDTKRKTKRTK